jgi:NAD+ kinase
VDRALDTLTEWARAHSVDVVQVTTEGDNRRELAPPGTVAPGDVVVALGGDGTVLAALRASVTAKVPVLGVACGSLGALSAVAADELAGALERVWAGDWTPRSLPALAVEAEGLGQWAINDFVVVRHGAGQLLVEVAVDGERYVRLAGDGLIVATALGSSAYSMAAGGPVLAAGTPAFVCTPLAMHGGSAPPLVVAASSTVTLDVQPGYAGFDAEVDGRRQPSDPRRFQLTLHPDKLTLVGLAETGRGLEGLRRRRLITDSPRVLARDDRARSGEG